MYQKNRAWAEVDLDAIVHNVKEIKKHLNPGVKLLGIVKADAYGHGVGEVARTILDSGVTNLAVAFCDEAVELRQMGFDAPILILGNSFEENIEKIVEYDVAAAVSSVDFARKVSLEAVKQNKIAKLHIKIDTGMSRVGFVSNSEDTMCDAVQKIIEISELPNVEIEGMFTHFAASDEEDESYTVMQYERFMALDEKLRQKGIKIPIKHACNSAAIVKFPHMQLDMVRAGIIIYGLYPNRNFDKSLIDLVPAMSFKSRVAQVKNMEKGSCVSYGRTYKCDKDSKIATVSVGYADGYSRLLSDKAEVVVDGCRVKQIGRICMDQCMIDATGVNNINVGDDVTLFGNDGLSADDVAELMGTIHYEVVCNIGRRVPRIYIKNGRIVETLNHILFEQGL